jgi:hypothetical protein
MEYIKVEHDALTGETVEREMTKTEIAEAEEVKAMFDAETAQVEADAKAKQALLKKLGITAEEAALLLK